MKQITNKIYQIGLGGVNAFIIEDNGLTLVDTGYKNSTDKIFSAIKKSGKNPEDIKQVILTHCHNDHVGSAAEIKKRLGTKMYAHTLDADIIEKGISARLPFKVSPGIMNKLLFRFIIKPKGIDIEPVKIDERLKDGDVIPIAGGIQVIHTPGHSAGHISLLVKNEGVLIAGDICANMFGLGVSIVSEEIELGIESIQKAAAFDFDKAVFGHGRLLDKNASKKLRAKFTPANVVSGK